MQRVAIIGAGAAGASLAFRLARAGIDAVMFDPMQRPPLVVGESTLPAIIPFLRELGLEEEVAGYSVYKPGASFVLPDDAEIHVSFGEVRDARVTYAYNIPRADLDASVTAAAVGAGATLVEERARVERVPGSDRVRLAPESRDAAEEALRGAPELVVDASGRSRTLARLLDLPAREGPRKDTVLFAHCEGVPLLVEGNIHVDLLERGWCWRIPLPGRTSVGLVIPSEHIEAYGDSNATRYDRYLTEDPRIARWRAQPKRVTDVLKYSNYQLIHDRTVGDGWALCGDSFGFVDPVFSSGTLLAFHGARALARAIVAGGTQAALERYARRHAGHIRAWQSTVGRFYDGRLLTLFQVGEEVRDSRMGRLIDPHLRKHLPRVFTGEGSDGWYSPALVDFMCRRALLDHDPKQLAV